MLSLLLTSDTYLYMRSNSIRVRYIYMVPAQLVSQSISYTFRSALDWTGLDWTGLDWTGLDWTGLDWTGLDWTGLDWTGLDWTGLDWTGLDWTGLDWTGLDWTGLHEKNDSLGCLVQNAACQYFLSERYEVGFFCPFV